MWSYEYSNVGKRYEKNGPETWNSRLSVVFNLLVFKAIVVFECSLPPEIRGGGLLTEASDHAFNLFWVFKRKKKQRK